jgi:membrane-bound ClpP family serine protease
MILMDWWLLGAILLYFACAVLLAAEVFRPSGGLIAVFAMVCLIGGLMMFFRSSTVAGWVGIVAALIMIPKKF